MENPQPRLCRDSSPFREGKGPGRNGKERTAINEGRLLERWPKGPDGEPEKAVPLMEDGDFAGFAGVHSSLLEACGVPHLLRRSGYGQLGALYGGYSVRGVKVYVPESLLDEAKTLMETTAERNLSQTEFEEEEPS